MESPKVEYNEIRNCGRKIAEINPIATVTPISSFDVKTTKNRIANPFPKIDTFNKDSVF